MFMKSKKIFPFEKRNEEDYQVITERIKNALLLLSENPKIPATQEKLAEISECSRKTLHNRRWAVEELKKIKQNRALKKLKQGENPNSKKKDSLEISSENLKEIKVLRNENALQFDIIQSKEEEINKLQRINLTLNKANAELEKEKLILAAENKELRMHIRLLKPSIQKHIVDSEESSASEISTAASSNVLNFQSDCK